MLAKLPYSVFPVVMPPEDYSSRLVGKMMPKRKGCLLSKYRPGTKPILGHLVPSIFSTSCGNGARWAVENMVAKRHKWNMAELPWKAHVDRPKFTQPNVAVTTCIKMWAFRFPTLWKRNTVTCIQKERWFGTWKNRVFLGSSKHHPHCAS